jgi:hypothetical protein
MFLTIYLHPFIAVAALLGGIYVSLMFMTGASEFTLNPNGISRQIATSLKLGKNKSPKQDFFKWSQIQWFKEGTDRGRYSAEYRFLTVHFKNGTEWMITDNNGVRKADFEVFLDTFKKLVAEYNALAAASPAASASSADQQTSTKAPELIRQRKTFYETIWAKAFTVLLGFFIAGIIFLMFTTSYVGATSMFKLFVVLIPGFIYMWYRVFREKK